MAEHNKIEDRVLELERLLFTLIRSDRYIFGKDLEFDDGRNIHVSAGVGTKIGTTTTQKIGFWNTTPVNQPDALTAQDTSITHTSPGTPDFAIQDLTQTTPFGFVTQDEGNTVLQVILNIQVRLAEVEARLEELGLVASN